MNNRKRETIWKVQLFNCIENQEYKYKHGNSLASEKDRERADTARRLSALRNSYDVT